MTIDFRCTNIAEYDEVTRSYRPCNQRLRVADSRAGAFVKCPKCENRVQVPETPVASGNKTVASEQTNIRRTGQRQPTARPVKSGVSDLSNENRDLMAMEFAQESPKASRPAATRNKRRCPRCGAIFEEQRICHTCGYVDPVQEALRKKKEKAPIKTAGFQLWLNQIATEGVSMATIGLSLFVIMAVFMSLVIVAGILTTSIMGSIASALAAFGLIFLIMVFLKTKEIAREGHWELGILSPVWQGVLLLARSQNWQNYDSSLKGRKIIDRRKAPIDDFELGQLDDLNECQVLDLENSTITDEGLKLLYGLPHLRCLVLKNNNVSGDAVLMLQQQNRRLWIWV